MLVRVIQVPEYLDFYCKECSSEIEIPYEMFVEKQGSYPGDWNEIECTNCYKKHDITELEWD